MTADVPRANEPHTHRHARTLLGRSALVHLLGVGCGGLFSIVLTVGLSRRLGYDDLGVYTFGLGGLVLTAMITRLGLDTAVLHYAAKHRANGATEAARAHAHGAMLLATALGVLGGAALWFAAPYATAVFGDPRLANVVRAFAFGVPLYNILYVGSGALRGAGKVVWSIACSQVLFPLASLLGAATVLLLRPGLVAVAVSTVAALGLAAAVALWRFLVEFPGARLAPPMREIAHFGLGSLAIQLLNQGIYWYGIYALGVWATTTDVGHFRAAAHAALPLTLFADAFASLYVPVSSRLLQRGDLVQLSSLTRSVARLTFFATGTVSLPTILLPALALGPFGSNLGPVAVPFALLAFSHALVALLGPLSWLLITGERLGLSMLAKAPALLLGVALGVVLIPRYGVPGAAMATCAAILGSAALHCAFVATRIGVHPFSRPLARGLAFYLGLLLAGLLLVEANASAAVLVVAAATVLFIGGGAFLALTRGDRDVLRGILRLVVHPTSTPVAQFDAEPSGASQGSP